MEESLLFSVEFESDSGLSRLRAGPSAPDVCTFSDISKYADYLLH